ncbi:MAG: hypothetical protein KatS3mg044_0995 [Rhodothermaceae bacterium]|nr:MAG: hypothetical protein KatS3mg044_0995 [Rhodothermaceae bacterium]
MVMRNIRNVSGFVTKERFILGKTPREMARLLGFDAGRMSEGAEVYALTVLPSDEQFELAGYTYWSGLDPARKQRDVLWPREAVAIDRRLGLPDPEVRARKRVRNSWSLHGPDRLVKVIPRKPHVEGVSEYPPGTGVPQWVLRVALPAVLVKTLGPDEPYRPYGGVGR